MSEDSKSNGNLRPVDEERIRVRIEQMEKGRQAGNWPENVEVIVCRLGYSTYSEYLEGDLWQTIRTRVMERDLWTCQRCWGKADEVHHCTYTAVVMRGEYDDALISLCAPCHREVTRTGEEKQRIVEYRENGKRKQIETLRLKAFDEQTKKEAGGRCFWCMGNTEIEMPWGSDGKTYVIPTVRGDDIGVWMCSVCASVLDVRSDEEKLKLLRRKPNIRYNRHKPGTSFKFKGFWKLNAMQRESLMNEYNWNCANIHRSEHQSPEETRRFTELKQRYEETRANGR